MTACSSSAISELFSTLSLISWVCAQLPQIISNYKAKSAEGISPSFLLLWFMGDFLSFTSCLLNDAALNFQVYLSVFFLANDLTLCYQYYYYNSIYPRTHFQALPQNEETVDSNVAGATHSSEIHDPTKAIHIRPLAGAPDAEIFMEKKTSESLRSPEKELTTPSSSLSPAKDQAMNVYGFGSTGTSPKLGSMTVAAGVLLNTGLAQAFDPESSTDLSITAMKETLGIILAWGCMCVYISSRCPQLYKNYLRKSVDGISPLLFGSALLGNLTYTLSVLTSCEFLSSENKTAFFLKQLPYLLGSAGTILFDVAYFYQRYIYRVAGANGLDMSLEDWHEA